jgi:hypothetical protein
VNKSYQGPASTLSPQHRFPASRWRSDLSNGSVVHPNPALVNPIEILLRQTNPRLKAARPPEVSFDEWIDIFTSFEVNEA